MRHTLTLKNTIKMPELENMLREVTFRGLYNKKAEHLQPYKEAKFSFGTVYPPKNMGSSPEIDIRGKREILYSPQPTIYENQIEIMKILDGFLSKKNLKLNSLRQAIEYEWEGRGIYHVLPPIIEKHSYVLQRGFFDLDKLTERFKNCYTKDALGNLHDLSKRYLNSFYIDEVSAMNHLDIFHSNASLINYGTNNNGLFDFYIICDGVHRIDYGLERTGKPITVIVAESKGTPLIPYYAFPFPFRPTIRLSSKRSERMYPRLERDKVHLFNDFIKKILHYDWTAGGLNVSSLRSQVEIY